MAIERYFKLNLNAGHNISQIVHVNQYDQGEEWYFSLYQDTGEQYFPDDGAIIGVKADGNLIDNAATVDGRGYVVVTETQQMTAAAGKAVFELQIDGGTHGTANFIVLVEPSPADDGVVSDSDLSLIQEAINSTNPAAIAQGVSDWMDENLTPTTPVVDATLTVSGAAADAKKTGDEIGDLKSQISDIEEQIEGGVGGLDLSDLSMTAVQSQTEGYSTLTLSDGETSKTVDIPVASLDPSDTTLITNIVEDYLDNLVNGDEVSY